jgi:hypothetical protein
MVWSSTTDNIQEHRAFLDLSGHTARVGVGRAGMPGVSAGALELAASFLASDPCTDIHGSEKREGGVLESRELAMAVTRTLAR